MEPSDVNEPLTPVKKPLTPKRPQREVTNDKYAEFAARIIKAFGQRVGHGDIMDLQDLLEYQELVDEVVRQAVVDIKQRGSYSWAEIGKAAGMSKQAAQQKWGRG